MKDEIQIGGFSVESTIKFILGVRTNTASHFDCLQTLPVGHYSAVLLSLTKIKLSPNVLKTFHSWFVICSLCTIIAYIFTPVSLLEVHSLQTNKNRKQSDSQIIALSITCAITDSLQLLFNKYSCSSRCFFLIQVPRSIHSRFRLFPRTQCVCFSYIL